jgi:hypothetical protein
MHCCPNDWSDRKVAVGFEMEEFASMVYGMRIQSANNNANDDDDDEEEEEEEEEEEDKKL